MVGHSCPPLRNFEPAPGTHHALESADVTFLDKPLVRFMTLWIGCLEPVLPEPSLICRLFLDQHCTLRTVQVLVFMGRPIPCNCFYINLIENWPMLTSLIIPVSQSVLFDTKSTYLQKTERRVLCPVLKVCCGSETRLNHFIFLRK